MGRLSRKTLGAKQNDKLSLEGFLEKKSPSKLVGWQVSFYMNQTYLG